MSLTKNLKNRAVFFDRDGVINVDRNDYTYCLEDFQLMPGIIEVMQALKKRGFLLIVITNQAGIAKGIYTDQEVDELHDHFQNISGQLVNSFYHAPGHPDYSESLSRKPDSLLFEKAIAKFKIDPGQSWMIGDKERDLIPAKKLGMKTVLLGNQSVISMDFRIKELSELNAIIQNK
ncbi:MAG: HAD-IIIA family hydrolase [Cytophagales bacterium]|nr:HAD-IIIA family hydrolase [Cytophagales bacterium]